MLTLNHKLCVIFRNFIIILVLVKLIHFWCVKQLNAILVSFIIYNFIIVYFQVLNSVFFSRLNATFALGAPIHLILELI